MTYVKHFGVQIPEDVANIASLSLFNFHKDEFKQKAVMLARAVSDRGGLVDQLYEKTKALEAAKQELERLRMYALSQPCKCQLDDNDNAVVCDVCYALGKEKP